MKANSPILPIRSHFQDSPLTQEAWQQFFKSGYCIARGVFDSFEIAKLRSSLQDLERIARELAHDRSLIAGIEHRLNHKGSLFVLDKSDRELKSLKRVVGCGSVDPTLLNSSRSPKLMAAFSDLLLSKCMEQLICQFHPKKPGDDVAFAPHRDIEHRLNYDANWIDVNGFGSYAIAVISVDPSSAHNGGLYLVPESHLGFDLSQVEKAADNFNENWSLRAYAPQLESGDVLFMHPYLVHWSTPNHSIQSRMSLLSGMCSVGANQGVYPGDLTNEKLCIEN